jgi:hypothetical protein
VSALLALAWLAWGRDGAASGSLDFAVSDRAHAAVRPHLQKADLAGFVAAHARHDPVGALRHEEKSRGGTRRHGAGFGSGEETTSPFPKAWGEDVVSSDADPNPTTVLAPANPEPPSPPPRADERAQERRARVAVLAPAASERRRGGDAWRVVIGREETTDC